MFLHNEPLIEITEITRRIGMDAQMTQTWLAEHGPESLGDFNYRELIVFAGQNSSSPWKARMGVWPSILTRWAGYAWERGDTDVALHIIHIALMNVGRITAQRDWPRVLSELPRSGQVAMGAYMKQVDTSYWNGKYSPLPRHCRKNLDTINAPSRYKWVTEEVLEGWSDQDVLRIASGTEQGSFGRDILPLWLGSPENFASRMSLLQSELSARPGQDDAARDALIGNMAATCVHSSDGVQRGFFDALDGPGALAALRGLTRTRYPLIYIVALERQVPYIAQIYNRIGAATWDVQLPEADGKTIRQDIQRPELWSVLEDGAKRNLVLLVLATGVEDEQRAWLTSALTELCIPIGIMDVVAALGLRSWPGIADMVNTEMPAAILPEMSP